MVIHRSAPLRTPTLLFHESCQKDRNRRNHNLHSTIEHLMERPPLMRTEPIYPLSTSTGHLRGTFFFIQRSDDRKQPYSSKLWYLRCYTAFSASSPLSHTPSGMRSCSNRRYRIRRTRRGQRLIASFSLETVDLYSLDIKT